jgi:hypothetical protein
VSAGAAGYSGTPLVRKLGVGEGMRVAWLGAPDGFEALLQPLPDGLVRRTSARGRLDLAVLFTTERAVLARRLPALREAIRPDGMVWAAWPKRAAKVPTDVTEDVVRDVALPLGLVDVKVCAIDATWSGLKLVLRRELR